MSKVLINWEGNMKFVGVDDSNIQVPMDASEIYGGLGQGVRPMELMLMSLGGCTGIEVTHILKKMRITFEELNIEVKGNRVDDHPKVFGDIQVIYRFKGANVPAEKVNKALQLAEQVYCSAANMMNKVAKIDYCFEINGVKYEYKPKTEDN
ncbi:OsmC family protein [Desulforamulus ferrireducens]|uniref:Osmotically inducible protein OsmC n=1 Tax=Desulforamulus ferrireducens TaxID=1833852 RepID=A0A1S6ITF9_9FIRM|nr:OsmC family protein [Desulforamulus ferrireducens]AQS58055.1 osmotically inducible protein OsmC [Desulforamulus ferrireducens]